MEHKGTQTLQTERLRLRRFTPADAHDMYTHWANDAEVTQYLTWYPHQSEEETRQLLTLWAEAYEQPTTYHWAIELAGTLIGDIAVVASSDNHASCEIGYCMGKDWWNNGYVTEAFRAVIGFLFDEVGYHRIVAKHDQRNPASGKVMLKCGLQYEGTHRDSQKVKGEYVTTVNYALLSTDNRY